MHLIEKKLRRVIFCQSSFLIDYNIYFRYLDNDFIYVMNITNTDRTCLSFTTKYEVKFKKQRHYNI